MFSQTVLRTKLKTIKIIHVIRIRHKVSARVYSIHCEYYYVSVLLCVSIIMCQYYYVSVLLSVSIIKCQYY